VRRITSALVSGLLARSNASISPGETAGDTAGDTAQPDGSVTRTSLVPPSHN
jgi:hypothetical protein